jgi:hypothetical protein
MGMLDHTSEEETPMRYRMMIAGCIVACLVVAPLAARAQLPGGVQIPGLSKDALLKQAKDLVSELTAMKSSASWARTR